MCSGGTYVTPFAAGLRDCLPESRTLDEGIASVDGIAGAEEHRSGRTGTASLANLGPSNPMGGADLFQRLAASFEARSGGSAH
jgi:hypothetical protein